MHKMKFIEGTSRHQTYFATLDDQVAPDNSVRLIDAFVDKLQLQKLGFANTSHKSEGRPPYEPAVLLKLYLYGYLNKIRSSRKLERECSRNLELQWLLKQLRSTNTTASGRSLSEWRTVAMQGVGEGQRNIWVTRLAGQLLSRDIDPIVSLHLILAWNQVHNRPPLPQDEVIKTVDAIAGRELRRRQGGPRHG